MHPLEIVRRGSLALLLAVSPPLLGCAVLLDTEHMGCPKYPMPLTEVRAEPEFVLSTEELRRRVSELAPFVRFDTPSNTVTAGVTSWFESSELGSVNCLRLHEDVFRQSVAKEDSHVLIRAQSVASLGEGKNESVVIRTGTRLSVYHLWTYRVVNFDGPDRFDLAYLSATVDLTSFIPDAPSGYLYLLDGDKTRWDVSEPQHKPVIMVPMAAGEIDVSRVGYILLLTPSMMPGQKQFVTIRPLRITPS